MLKGSANAISALILVATAVFLAVTLGAGGPIETTVAIALVGVYLSASPRVIQEWERGVLLRLGKFRRMLQPGIQWVIPGADSIAALVDMRIRSTSFAAEDALTRTL